MRLSSDTSTLASKTLPRDSKEIIDQSSVRHSGAFTFNDFTRMTPEKFMATMPEALATIRGRHLSEAEIEQLNEFTVLLEKEQPFYDAFVTETKTLSGVRWLIENGRDFPKGSFPGVCYEAACGVSAVLQRAGIPHRRVCRIKADGTGRHNYVSVILCGVECIIDLTFENFMDEYTARTEGEKASAGIMIVPRALCGDDRLHAGISLYDRWNQYADVEYGMDGKIRSYAFFEPNSQRQICTGTVAENITFTLDNITKIQIQLTSEYRDQPIRLVVIDHAEPADHTGSTDIRVSYGANKSAMTALDAGESVSLARKRGGLRHDGSDRDQVYTELTLQRTDGTFKTIHFRDPQLSTTKKYFIERQLVDAGIRETQDHDMKEPFGVADMRAFMIDAEAVRNSEAPDMADMSAYTDDELRSSFLWKDAQRAWFVKDRFPDGEIYVRALNAEKIRGRDIVYACDITKNESLLTLVFMIDIANRYGARSLRVYFDDWMRISNASYRESICDAITAATANSTVKVEGYGKTGQTYQRLDTSAVPPYARHMKAEATIVVAIDERLTKTAEDLAKRLKVPAMTVIRRDPHYEKHVKKLAGERVILVHSMSNNAMTEDLLEVLPHLKRTGVESVFLALTYLSYARQDKEFPGKSGAAVSGRAIAEYLYRWADTIYAVTTHVTGKDVQGPVQMGNAEVLNLNGFTQIVEYAFGLIQEGLAAKFKRTTGRAPAKADMRQLLIDEFRQRPLYLVGPDQGSAIAVDHAREVLQKRLHNKFSISQQDVEVKVAFMKKKRFASDKVQMENMLYRFKRQDNKIVYNELNKPEGEARDMDEINREGWVFLVDDEISTGGTTKAALYVLMREIGFRSHRILTLWVHGKFPKGLDPIIGPETLSPDMIVDGVATGRLAADHVVDEKTIVNEGKREALPVFIATTNSYFSRGASKKVIQISDLMNVDLHRLFSYELHAKDVYTEKNTLLEAA